MPLYEYYCPDCRQPFEILRGAARADDPAACPSCQQESTQRILSLFASAVKSSGSDAGAPMMSGGGCCGGGACACGRG
jgi:putative FmdB family regulatory protein